MPMYLSGVEGTEVMEEDAEDILEEEHAHHTNVTADREKRLNVEHEGEGYCL